MFKQSYDTFIGIDSHLKVYVFGVRYMGKGGCTIKIFIQRISLFYRSVIVCVCCGIYTTGVITAYRQEVNLVFKTSVKTR